MEIVQIKDRRKKEKIFEVGNRRGDRVRNKRKDSSNFSLLQSEIKVGG